VASGPAADSHASRQVDQDSAQLFGRSWL